MTIFWIITALLILPLANRVIAFLCYHFDTNLKKNYAKTLMLSNILLKKNRELEKNLTKLSETEKAIKAFRYRKIRFSRGRGRKKGYITQLPHDLITFKEQVDTTLNDVSTINKKHKTKYDF